MSETSSKPSDLAARLTRGLTPAPTAASDADERDDDFDLDAEDGEEGAGGENGAGDDDSEEDEVEDEIVETRVAPTVISRKKRKKERAVANANKSKGEPRERTHDEIPRDEILALMSRNYTEVRLEIKRQAPNGTWANIRAGIICPPAALFDLQPAVEELAGGGTFVFDVTDSNTRAKLCPRWREHYDGMPKPPPKGYTIAWDEAGNRMRVVAQEGSISIYDAQPGYGSNFQQNGQAWMGAMGMPGVPNFQQALTAVPGQPMTGSVPGMPPVYEAMQQGPQPQYNGQGQMLAPPPELVPPWLKGFSPAVQWNHIMTERREKAVAMAPNDAGPWVHHEIRQSGDLKANLAAANTRIEAMQRSFDEKLEAIRQQSVVELERAKEEKARAEREAERAHHAAEMKALETRMAALAERKPAVDLPAIAMALAPFAPVAAAWLTSGNETRKVERESETRLLTTMFTANASKKEAGLTEMVTAVAPIVAPFLLKMLEMRGPQAQAEVHAIEHEQRMMQLKMFADMIQATSPEPEPAWKGIIDGVMGMFATTMQQRQLLAGNAPRVMGPGAAPPAPTQQQSPVDKVLADMRMQDAEAAADVELVFQRLPQAMGFHTHEWLVILFNLHARNDLSELVPMLCDHLVHCAGYGLLPQPLAEVFDKPQETLETVLGMLPIAKKDPDYIRQVITQAAQALADVEREEEEPEDDADEAALASTAVITPAPNKSGGLLTSAMIE